MPPGAFSPITHAFWKATKACPPASTGWRTRSRGCRASTFRRGAVCGWRRGPVGPVGCVALRPHPAPGAAEIKRLWVAPEGRGLGTGRALVLAVISAAKELGYDRVLLDTAPGMQAAHALYRDLGFTERPPYDGTPMPGLLYFEREV